MNAIAKLYADVLLFVKPTPYQCFSCQRPIQRRGNNSPAFCSYECGANGQPEHCKKSMRNTVGGNNPKS